MFVVMADAIALHSRSGSVVLHPEDRHLKVGAEADCYGRVRIFAAGGVLIAAMSLCIDGRVSWVESLDPRQQLGLAERWQCIYYGYTDSHRRAIMAQAILKWGNSLAFRIPSAIAKQMEIAEGAEVEFRIEGKQLIVEKADEMPSFTDRDLLRALRKAKSELVNLGRPRGGEIL
jgi:antitoxin component of MazEF toxin-antitoxin module